MSACRPVPGQPTASECARWSSAQLLAAFSTPGPPQVPGRLLWTEGHFIMASGEGANMSHEVRWRLLWREGQGRGCGAAGSGLGPGKASGVRRLPTPHKREADIWRRASRQSKEWVYRRRGWRGWGCTLRLLCDPSWVWTAGGGPHWPRAGAWTGPEGGVLLEGAGHRAVGDP